MSKSKQKRFMQFSLMPKRTPIKKKSNASIEKTKSTYKRYEKLLKNEFAVCTNVLENGISSVTTMQ